MPACGALTYPRGELIPEGHELILHVLAYWGDELHPLRVELFEESLGKVSLIPEELAIKLLS